MKTTVRKSRKAISKGIARICAHYIEWRLNDRDIQLSAMDIEYITNSLIDNCVEGELCAIAPNGQIVSGYWNIQF
jgi:hypothetical protein